MALGFDPAESLVMVRIGAGGPHARVDLPDEESGRREARLCLIHACVTHDIERVALAVYAEHPERWADWVAQVSGELERVGVRVLEVLGVTERHWSPLLEAPERVGGGWRVTSAQARIPHDPRTHVFRVQAIVEGQLVLGSREELAELLTTEPERVEETARALADLAPLVAGSTGGGRVRREERWVRETLAAHASAGTLPDPRARARILRGMGIGTVRDRTWAPVRRDEADSHLNLWCAMVRASPPAQVADAASTLGYLAWLAGSGALAWTALDLAEGSGPLPPLGNLVTGLLQQAAAPSDVLARSSLPARDG